MSDIVTIANNLVATERALAAAESERKADLEALWAAERKCIVRLEAELTAAHPVVEAAVAAVEAHFADARLRELALVVKHFTAHRGGAAPADN